MTRAAAIAATESTTEPPAPRGPSLRRLRRRDARLVPVAAAAWIGAAFATVHVDLARPVGVGLWVAAVVALCVAVRVRGPARTWLALTAVALASTAAVCTNVALVQPERAALAAVDVGGGRAITIDATAVGKIERSAAGWRFDATASRVRLGTSDQGGASFGRAGVPVLVRLGDAATLPAGLDLGASVRLTGTAWRAEPGERAVLVIDANGAPEVLRPPEGVLAVASALRRGLLETIRSLPPPGGGLIAGLAVGDTSLIAPELDAAMKTSSLSHLTAVSGANCALVVGLAFGAAALCRARRRTRGAAGVTALVAFVILVSPEPSVVRAAAMAAIAMLGILLGRPGAGLSLLTAAVVVLLLLDPWLGLSLGFALSAAATGALLVGAGPLAAGLARWMPRPLALALSVPLAAQLACGPLIVLISPQLSVYGIVANTVAAPAAPVGTIVGLAACLTAGIPLLGSGLAALAWLPASWIATTATLFAGLPGSVVAWPEGLWGLVALTLLGAAVTALIIPVPHRVRAGAVLVLTAALGTVLATGPIADGIDRARIPGGWAIAACDVGQGDAVLIRSGDAVALVDTGPDPAPLTACLADLGIRHIDLLVLTHFDLDHRGGIAAVQGRVGTVLHGPTDGAEDAAILDRLAADGAAMTAAATGISGTLGASRWRVLWPRSTTAPGNDASVVVDFRGGGVPTSLFLGDLSAAGQQAMAADALLLDGYQVVKVAHHGSADQDPDLYARVHPALALVTVGENDYGHPRTETLDLLSDVGARIARTDRGGLIAVWTDADGAGLRLWSARTPVAVAPDG